MAPTPCPIGPAFSRSGIWSNWIESGSMIIGELDLDRAQREPAYLSRVKDFLVPCDQINARLLTGSDEPTTETGYPFNPRTEPPKTPIIGSNRARRGKLLKSLGYGKNSLRTNKVQHLRKAIG
jgi:hypothetical protein